MNEEKLRQIQKLLDAAEGNLHSARNLMREVTGAGNAPTINPEEKAKGLNVIEEGKIIEGVYNGEAMVGPDGKEFPVPANYASKSKLVEGDVLKLTIAEDGSFIFKQIKPIDRRKALGTLAYSDGSYTVSAEGKTYKVLQASVTYYKGEAGDQVSLILPKEHESTWGAVENIIKQPAQPSTIQQTDTGTAMGPVDATESQIPAEDSVVSQDVEPEIVFPQQPATSEQATDTIAQSVETTSTEPQPLPTADNDDNKPNEGIKELEI